MRDSRYLSALAAALRGTALPYGYTLTVSTSGMMLAHQRGLPSVGEIFLFMTGAIIGFASLGLVVRLASSEPFEPSSGDLWLTGMIQLLAVGRLGVILPDRVGFNHVAVRVDDLRALVISHDLPLPSRACRDISAISESDGWRHWPTRFGPGATWPTRLLSARLPRRLALGGASARILRNIPPSTAEG